MVLNVFLNNNTRFVHKNRLRICFLLPLWKFSFIKFGHPEFQESAISPDAEKLHFLNKFTMVNYVIFNDVC